MTDLDDLERDLDAALLEVARTRYVPQTPTERQRAFLDVDAREALYGGAAGGGKSSALLMELLAPVDVPGYSALALRRTLPELAMRGGLMDRAAEWLHPTGATWNGDRKTWTFPHAAGPPATLAFGFMDTEVDRFRYAGAEFQRIAHDELTQFTELQYTFPLSRLRRLKGFQVKPRARAGTNPGGPGHDWVFKRFVDPKREKAHERVFVPAKLDDNPHLERAEYEATLAELDEMTRAQLRDGLWVRDRGGLVYHYLPERNRVGERPAADGWRYILAVDLGASQKVPTTAFVVIAFCYTIPVAFVVRAERVSLKDVTETAEHIKALGGLYDFVETVVDVGGLGGQFLREFNNRHGLACREAEKSNKLGFRRLVNAALEKGTLRVVADECEPLIEELTTLEWDEKGLDARPGQADHCTDALIYGFRACKAYLAEPPAAAPPHGSAEWYEAEEKRLLELDEQPQRDQPWWTQ